MAPPNVGAACFSAVRILSIVDVGDGWRGVSQVGRKATSRPATCDGLLIAGIHARSIGHSS